MNPYYRKDNITVYQGDVREVLPAIGIQVDHVVTDPPYGLSFMEAGWDQAVPGPEYWQAIENVCKPGASLLAFGGTRTFHRLTCAMEDAGWEIRDCLMWLYGQGFPKSLDIGKAIDKAAGAEREVVGRYQPPGMEKPWNLRNAKDERTVELFASSRNNLDITAPATDAAKQWQGWGTALKPAWEPIVLGMNPLDGTFAANAEKHGVAGLNIDGCRITTSENLNGGAYTFNGTTRDDGWGMRRDGTGDYQQPAGRFPANLLLDQESAQQLDAQAGTLTSGMMKAGQKRNASKGGGGYHGHMPDEASATGTYGDSGGASRFFHIVESDPCDHNLRPARANIAGSYFNLQNVVDDSVLNLAAISAAQGPSNEPLAHFLHAMQTALRSDNESSTQLILSAGERCSQESRHMLAELSRPNPVNCAEILKLTSIISITQSLLSTTGFVKLVMSSTMLRSWAVGELDSQLRFRYCSKASKRERGEGNDHPTVKPIALMKYLLTLLSTPTGGLILDAFAGSGTTAVAAKELGRPCVCVELDGHNCEIIARRLEALNV